MKDIKKNIAQVAVLTGTSAFIISFIWGLVITLVIIISALMWILGLIMKHK